MIRDHLGQVILEESDLVHAIMQGVDITEFKSMLIDQSVDLKTDHSDLVTLPDFKFYDAEKWTSVTQEQFDQQNQQNWHMPLEYQQLDIAEYVLNLCTCESQIQRVGQELLLYQQKNLFNLLRYLKYLVDTMQKNDIIWGVGRGSSVASYVLYLLGVHKIDSLYYQLDPTEFLR